MKKIANALRNLRRKRRKADLTASSATVVAATNVARSNELIVTPDIEDAGVQHCDSGLERLPAEIRRHILSVMDLHCLKALIRTSPTFHQQYLLDRRYLLNAALQVTLGSVSFDAYMTQKAMALQETVPHQRLSGLLETWQEQLPHISSFRLVDAITEAEAVDMVSVYLQTVAPIAKHYTERALKDLEDRIGEASHQSVSQPEPSNIEWQRCLRAIYRFQLLCCAAKPGPELSHEIPASCASRLFLTLEPWESEALLSFYQFVEAVYGDIFDDIAVEVHPENPRFDDQDRPPTPVGAFEFHNSFFVRNYQEGTTLRGGLDLLRTVLVDLKPDNRESLVNIMQRNIVSSYIPLDIFTGFLSDTRQYERRRQAPSHRDELTNERALLPFQGDCLYGPPLAWTTIWGGTYSNLIGMYMPDEMRRWGYVFWDADRLEGYGGMDVLCKQWEDRWDDEDPRDYIY